MAFVSFPVKAKGRASVHIVRAADKAKAASAKEANDDTDGPATSKPKTGE